MNLIQIIVFRRTHSATGVWRPRESPNLNNFSSRMWKVHIHTQFLSHHADPNSLIKLLRLFSPRKKLFLTYNPVDLKNRKQHHYL